MQSKKSGIVAIATLAAALAATPALAQSHGRDGAAHVSSSGPASDAVVRLFHPREDQWEDHFQVAPESGEIVGRTPIGRATVARLGINSAAQVAARQQWMRLGLFP